MTDTEIQGRFEIFYNGELDHTSGFTGRGFTQPDGSAWYEVRLQTPRRPDSVLIDHPEDFRLYYDPTEESFTVQELWFYSPKPEKIFSEN